MTRRSTLLSGLAVAVLFSSGMCTKTLAGLRLNYAFDGDLRDRGPSNNVGTVSGGAALTSVSTNVIVGTGALLLDGGTNSYVALSNSITFTASSAWSVAFWARRSGSADKGMVIGSRFNTTDFIWLNDSFTGLRFRSSNSTTVNFTVAKDQNTHHYALVATGGGALSLYIDGIFSSTQTGMNTSFLIDSVGKAYNGVQNYEFNGVLDDVRVYDSVLDAGAVSNLYLLGRAVHYAFDGDLSDSGAMKNNGTASGGAAVTTNSAYVVVGSGALLLDGGDTSYVALSNALTFAATDAWSTAFWACRSELTNDTGMVMGRRQTANDFIWLNNTFTGFRFRSSAGATLDFKTPKDLNVHHYALVAAGGGALSLYVDGILTTNVSGADTSFMIDTIGQAYPTTSHYAFKGVLDEVNIYPSALDAVSVQTLFKQGPALSLYYTFDGGFSDSGAFGNNGTASGKAAITNDPAKVIIGSGALALDGADNSNVALSNAISFVTGVPWSAAFWACRGETGGNMGMVMGCKTNNNDFIWLNDSFAGLRFRSSTGGSIDFTAPKDQSPHHYALVAEGDGTMSFYLDGVLSSNSPAANTSFYIDTVGQAYLTNSLHYGFKGILDDVRVYNYAVSDAAVSSLFAQGRNELLHYTFDSNFSDSSPAKNNGTASGGAVITTVPTQVAVGTGALSLDGADNSYVALSKTISLVAGAPWSAAFWARRGETGAGKGMVMGRNNTYTDFIWLNDNFSGLRFRSSLTNTVDFTAPKDLNRHHYALVNSGTNAMSLYIDGVLSESKAVTDTSFVIDTVGHAYYTSAQYGFSGILDDVHVYAYALSATNVATLGQQGKVTRVHVLLQGGQSNSEGRADPTGLPTTPVNLQGYQSDVDFYYLNTLSTLHPATSSGTQFGPEITFGRHFVDRLKPDAFSRVAIIKYSKGGTSLYSDWKAGGNATTTGDGLQYVSFQSMVSSGLAALASAYPSASITIDGMIWMQGESDVPTASAAYYANLTNFIADVRLTYNLPKLPFVVARLSASQTGAGNVTLLNVVRQAQTDVAAADPWTGLVNTDTFSLKSDALHFDTAGQQALGTAFADQLYNLIRLPGTLIRLY